MNVEVQFFNLLGQTLNRDEIGGATWTREPPTTLTQKPDFAQATLAANGSVYATYTPPNSSDQLGLIIKAEDAGTVSARGESQVQGVQVNTNVSGTSPNFTVAVNIGR